MLTDMVAWFCLTDFACFLLLYGWLILFDLFFFECWLIWLTDFALPLYGWLILFDLFMVDWYFIWLTDFDVKTSSPSFPHTHLLPFLPIHTPLHTNHMVDWFCLTPLNGLNVHSKCTWWSPHTQKLNYFIFFLLGPNFFNTLRELNVLNTCIYLHINIYVYTYTHLHEHIYLYTHIHTYIFHTHTHTHTHTQTQTHTHALSLSLSLARALSLSTHTHTHKHTHTQTKTHTHTHTHTHTNTNTHTHTQTHTHTHQSGKCAIIAGHPTNYLFRFLYF